MEALFQIETSFHLKARNMFVIGGILIKGEIKKGMLILDKSGQKTKKVDSVEIIDSDKKGSIGLCFCLGQEEDMEFLEYLRKGDLICFTE